MDGCLLKAVADKAMGKKDNRIEERIDVDMEIRFRFPEPCKGKVKDYCKGGIGVEVPIGLEVDAPIEIEIFKSNFLVEGRVRWVRKEKGMIRAGIRFQEEHHDLIENIHNWRGSLA